MPFVTPQLQSIDEAARNYANDWPVVCMERADVDGTEELFGVVQHSCVSLS
jgi:hypothetical protein